jgi:hypothetical protein
MWVALWKGRDMFFLLFTCMKWEIRSKRNAVFWDEALGWAL